jgi:manganese transport protein
VSRFGPGFLVAAAFIGPGTVTTASLAGARYGFGVAWAVVCAIVATLILQEMAARLGAVARLGLGEAMRSSIQRPLPRMLFVGLALLAVVFGNAAYQSGNLTGASLGLEALVGGPRAAWVMACALASAVLLASGAYRLVERVLMGLVAVMSLVFLVTAASLGPQLLGMLDALGRPTIPVGGGLVVLALIGTTVVPYNLFLHAAAVRQKWQGVAPERALRAARLDTMVAVGLGGLVTLAILVTAVPLYLAAVDVSGVAEMARQLEPVLGGHAQWLFALGLFAAGLTSAITAPLAAAWAASGLLGWPTDLHNRRFQAVWAVIIVVGASFAITGVRPVEAILLAQAANGLLLPLVACFLLWVMNQPGVVGGAVNGRRSNLLGGLVCLLSIILGITSIYRIVIS